jgi:hypothetical protein
MAHEHADDRDVVGENERQCRPKWNRPRSDCQRHDTDIAIVGRPDRSLFQFPLSIFQLSVELGNGRVVRCLT